MTKGAPTIVGDGVENPGNARTILHAAEMFAWDCLFRDRAGLDSQGESTADSLPVVRLEELREHRSPILALENAKGAHDLYGYRVRDLARLALVVGNERKGVARDTLEIVDDAVEIPMVSKRMSCLNVAAAAAVGMYFLERRGGGKLHTRDDPNKNRPEVLLMGATDQIELGSSIRSAAAFGWNRLFVEDRAQVWFGCDRVVRSEGRGAARRGRNPIRLVPTDADRSFAFDEVVIVSTREEGGTPIHKANLSRGPRQLVIIPDESALVVADEDLDRFGGTVRVVGLGLPRTDFPYHYRLISSIALAETSRQVGIRLEPGRKRPRPPVYDKSLDLLAEEAGETVFLEDLFDY